MRRCSIGLLAVGALAMTGCGGGGKFANQPRPPVPVNMSVYINDKRVSVSPTSVGAGPVTFIVTNQAATAQSVLIVPAGGDSSQALADTGPINPQATAQVSVNFTSPGNYTISAGPQGTSQAALATPSGVQPAMVSVGAPRPGAGNALLQP